MKCPHCGSNGNVLLYECGSEPTNQGLHRSRACEIIADLKKERNEMFRTVIDASNELIDAIRKRGKQC